METTIKEIKESYTRNLKAVDYIAMLTEVYGDDVGALRTPLTFIYDVLQSGRFKGSKLLEIGSGAVVHHIASASALFSNIIMSDYVEDNCEQLKRWLQGQLMLKQLLDIPAELEGYGKNLEDGKKLLENRIRSSVKQVVRCDVLTDNILLEEVRPEVAPPYDLIVSSLCLEAAVPDYDNFVLALKRINKLLRPGGGLILIGFLQGKKWKVKEVDYNYVQMNESDIRKALQKSGFGHIEMQIHNKKFSVDYEHDGFYCSAAEKM